MRTDVVGILKELLEQTNGIIKFVDATNNINNVNNKDFYFSRAYEKLGSLVFNYLRLDVVNKKIEFTTIESIVNNNQVLEKIKQESTIDLIAGVLRPTLELYLELKIIKYFVEKNNERKQEAIDISCESSNLINQFELHKQFLDYYNTFYNCKPKYYVDYINTFKKPVEDIKKSMSSKKLFSTSKISKKLEYVFNNSSEYEKMILGQDSFMLYNFLSKRMHYSKDTHFTNSIFPPQHYINWALAFFIDIFEMIYFFHDQKFTFGDELDNQLSVIKNMQKDQSRKLKLNIDDIVLLDFGIAKIIEIDTAKVKIQYIHTNYFKPDDFDDVPINFIQKLDNDKYNEIIKKYPNASKSLNENEYNSLIQEIKNTNKTLERNS